MRICLIFIVLLLNIVQVSYAQSNKNIDTLIRDYEELFIKSKSFTDTIIKNNKVVDREQIWQYFLNENFSKQTTNQLSIPTEEKKSLNNLGLNWVSDATYNFNPGFADSEDLFFRSKISTGFDWGILGEGSFLKQKKEGEVFKKQIKIDSLKLIDLESKITLDNKIKISQFIFDNYRINLLRNYSVVLKQQAFYYDKMFEAKLCSYSEKLKANQKLEEVLELIKLNEKYFIENNNDLINKYAKLPLAISNLPDLSLLNADQLLEDKLEILKLQNEISNDKNAASNGPNLKAKFRYNYYDNPNQSGRNFASIGATLSVPINSKKNDKLLDYEYNLGLRKINVERELLKEELISQHKAYSFLLNKLKHIENELIYIESLLDNEIKIKTSQHKDFSPSKYIKQADDLVQKQFEYINIKQQIFEKFIMFHMLSKINDKNISITEIEIMSAKNSSYLWSAFFNEKNNDDLIILLNNYNINKLFISPGNNTNEKLTDFLKKTLENDIEISRLIGENSFALDDNGWIKLIAKLNSLKNEGYKSIHLDIEPHTFEDYKVNKEKYIKILSNIFTKSKQWCDENNISLSVSVPMHLPLENALTLHEIDIETYIMAYDNVDQTKLLKKTEKLRNILKNNFVWVLRLSDFKSVTALKLAEKELNNSGIYKIGYYDLSMLNELNNEN